MAGTYLLPTNTTCSLLQTVHAQYTTNIATHHLAATAKMTSIVLHSSGNGTLFAQTPQINASY
jgi:hypothetical protein